MTIIAGRIGGNTTDIACINNIIDGMAYPSFENDLKDLYQDKVVIHIKESHIEVDEQRYILEKRRSEQLITFI